MIKKLFDWTPRDIAYWEKIRQKGLRKFIGWYGVVISSGLLFILFGLVSLFIWISQVTGAQITSTSFISLAIRLIFTALVSLLAGVINSLITWVVEERLYRKNKQAE
jgi:sorbitol-specific phosphotransferase system component IIC